MAYPDTEKTCTCGNVMRTRDIIKATWQRPWGDRFPLMYHCERCGTAWTILYRKFTVART